MATNKLIWRLTARRISIFDNFCLFSIPPKLILSVFFPQYWIFKKIYLNASMETDGASP